MITQSGYLFHEGKIKSGKDNKFKGLVTLVPGM